ncbi:hypothetical protein [Helicobacter sp. UBA3407]|uniref:hypothetical protein n=1 Tax=Helicobacter TaxID=209 RepID=UPI00262E3824|nr:hypothetical protein [Helicobacter sp. UBA3407]
MKHLRFLILFLICLLTNAISNEIVEEIKNIKQLDSQIIEADNFLNNPNNLWIKKYSNYQAYQQVIFNIIQMQNEINTLEKQPKSIETQNQLSILERNLAALEQQKEVLGVYKDSPFRELTEAKKLEEAPNVTNLLLIRCV